MCETTELDTDPVKTNTVQAACAFCSAENEMVEKLYPGQTYWQVDQICMACGERLRNLAWRQYEPEQIGLEGLEQMTLTFKIICEPKEAERLGWLSNDLDMKLNKVIAERLALTGRFNVALTTISWKAEEEFEDEKKDPRPDWFGESWCD